MYEIGTKLVTNQAGSNPLTVTIKKADLCIQMPLRAAISTSAFASTDPPLIDPNLMFQRAHAQASNLENPISMEECLTYELSPYPMSLFTDTGHMRLPQDKSELATDLIEKYDGLIQADANMDTTVLDGGALMHHVVWGKRKWKKDEPKPLVQDIVKLYVDKAKRESSTSSTIIVFDGYQRGSPKDHCRKIRSPTRGLEVDLDMGTPITSQQSVFLSIQDNKSSLIGFVTEALEDPGMKVARCQADADVTIAQTVFTEALKGKSVRLWGDDTDLMVILLHQIHQQSLTTDPCTSKIYMYRPSTRTTVDLMSLSNTAPTRVLRLITVVHAMSGCDTVSRIFCIGKTKLIKLLEDSRFGEALEPLLKVFLQCDCTPEMLLAAGSKIVSFICCKNQNRETLEEPLLW